MAIVDSRGGVVVARDEVWPVYLIIETDGVAEALTGRGFVASIFDRATGAAVATVAGTLTTFDGKPAVLFNFTGAQTGAAFDPTRRRRFRYRLAEKLAGGDIRRWHEESFAVDAGPVDEAGDPSSSAGSPSVTLVTIPSKQPKVARVEQAGPPGPAGTDGQSPIIEVGTITTGAAGSSASIALILIDDDPLTYRLDATLPRGTAGNTGATPSFTIGTVTSSEPGTIATATITGSATAPVLNLVIPRGDAGAVPQFSIGTVVTGAAGSSASATVGGTLLNPLLNLTLPQGATGATGAGPAGPGGSQELFATYAAAALVVGSLTLAQLVYIQADETRLGYATVYQKTGTSTLTFVGYGNANSKTDIDNLIDKAATTEAEAHASLLAEDGSPLLFSDLANLWVESGASTKLSALAASSALTGAELLAVEQGRQPRSFTPSLFASFVLSSFSLKDNIVSFDAAGTFTYTPSVGVREIYVVCIGGGGGGGGGSRAGAGVARGGGQSGAGGGWSDATIPATLLGATESVTVGAGGSGGATAACDTADGGAGAAGGGSTFGALIFAGGGARGLGGNRTAVLDAVPLGGIGSVVGGNGVATQGDSSGGTSPRPLGVAPGGGGAGGRINSSNTATGAGTGATASGTSTNGSGAGGTVAAPGGAATARAAGDTRGGGGGGGGGSGAANATSAGGNGSAGAFPGGGGGGGGASANGIASGAGGAGGAGRILIFESF